MTSHEGSGAAPDVVVVGAAARDVDPDERRGWRPGGAVSFVSLTLVRLGLRVGAVIGLDPVALADREPVALRTAGVELAAVPLVRGPVFENRETAAGREQFCVSTSERLPPEAVPLAWRRARAFVLAPIADELAPAWADVPAPDAFVALGWQGLLRELADGRPTRRRAPSPNPLGLRADLGAASRDDLSGSPTGALESLLVRPGQWFALTAGRAGGVLLSRSWDGSLAAHPWTAVPPRREIDAVGAGDVFLAGLVAAVLSGGLSRTGEEPPAHALDAGALRIAATAASLAVEEVGLAGVPDLAAIHQRLAELRAGRAER